MSPGRREEAAAGSSHGRLPQRSTAPRRPSGSASSLGPPPMTRALRRGDRNVEPCGSNRLVELTSQLNSQCLDNKPSFEERIRALKGAAEALRSAAEVCHDGSTAHGGGESRFDTRVNGARYDAAGNDLAGRDRDLALQPQERAWIWNYDAEGRSPSSCCFPLIGEFRNRLETGQQVAPLELARAQINRNFVEWGERRSPVCTPTTRPTCPLPRIWHLYDLGNLLGSHLGLQCHIRCCTVRLPWFCSAECSWFSGDCL
jgi:hypothetical protein